jgi:hypothetical protein
MNAYDERARQMRAAKAPPAQAPVSRDRIPFWMHVFTLGTAFGPRWMPPLILLGEFFFLPMIAAIDIVPAAGGWQHAGSLFGYSFFLPLAFWMTGRLAFQELMIRHLVLNYKGISMPGTIAEAFFAATIFRLWLGALPISQHYYWVEVWLPLVLWFVFLAWGVRLVYFAKTIKTF